MQLKTVLCTLALCCSYAFAQSTRVDSLISAGVKLHDQGFYAKAIEKYQQALALDSANYQAQSEMALSCFSLGTFEDAIAIDQRILSNCADSTFLKLAYITYGSCLDNLDRYAEAVDVYTTGISKFPNTSLLHFNLGVAYYNHGHFTEARQCFQNTLRINPNHASSNLSLARVMDTLGEQVPSIMAYSRFLLLEPNGERAHKAFIALSALLNANVRKEGGKNITVFMDTTKMDAKAEDDFRLVDMILSLTAALNLSDDKKNEKDQLVNSLTAICDGLKEQKPKNKGFFWDFYAPYLLEMQSRKYLETFAYMLLYFNRDEDYINDWVKTHQDKIKKVLDWSSEYQWKK